MNHSNLDRTSDESEQFQKAESSQSSALLAKWELVLDQLNHLIPKVNRLLPAVNDSIDFSKTMAAFWQAGSGMLPGQLVAIDQPHWIEDQHLQNIDMQKMQLIKNTEQFVNGQLANHVLLTGAKGCGKSSLIKSMLPRFADKGLRMIEVAKQDLHDLPHLIKCLQGQPYRFVVFCDDLVFDANDHGYMALKVVLDGSLNGRADHVVIYATSNRRHLLPEFVADNAGHTIRQGNDQIEIHPGETVDEKLALSERFGLWLSFYPFTQNEYLRAVAYWAEHFGVTDHATIEREALQWALGRGSRSGRVAYQFVISLLGR